VFGKIVTVYPESQQEITSTFCRSCRVVCRVGVAQSLRRLDNQDPIFGEDINCAPHPPCPTGSLVLQSAVQLT
jgi:hypothetical protein